MKNHLDLFSGIGGFSLGFEAAGYRTVAFSEIDPMASSVLQHWWPDVPNLGDVKTLDYERIKQFGEIEVITGGVPCQPASALGAMRGALDERWLWPDSIGVVRKVRPRFAVFENPPSILVLPDFRGIIGEITALGYDLFWLVIPAAAVGAGHLRERVFFILTDSSSSRRETRPGLRPSEPGGQWRGRPGDHNGPLPNGTTTNSHDQGLQGHPGNGSDDQGWEGPHRPASPADLRHRVHGADWWHEAHTGIPVLAHGISSKLAEAACRCAGNSIVPQVAQIIAETLSHV